MGALGIVWTQYILCRASGSWSLVESRLRSAAEGAWVAQLVGDCLQLRS